MATMIPHRTTAFNVYLVEGKLEAEVGIATVDLPEVTYKSDTLTLSGLGGDIDVPSANTEAMELTLNFAAQTAGVRKFARRGSHIIIIRAAQSSQDQISGVVADIGHRYEVTGTTKSYGGGSLEQSAASEATVVISVLKYGVFVGNREVEYIDVASNVHRVNGIDQKAALRALI